MSPDITLAAALFAGTVSFLSPCVLPLVPPYLVYLAGTSLERLAEAESEPAVRRDTVFAAMLFVLGFTTVFVALGAAASSVGSALIDVRRWLVAVLTDLRAATGVPIPIDVDPLAMIAGIAIIMMGLHFLGLTRMPFLMREKRIAVAKPVGLWGAYVMGLAFAFGWTPCLGPILGSILAIAASKATMAKGTGLLAIYSLGLGIPFIVAALAVEPFAVFLVRFRAHLARVEMVMGGLLVLTGIGFLTSSVTQASAWLLETFPGLGNFGW
jgi:cytochrome c-type biogenesis protein